MTQANNDYYYDFIQYYGEDTSKTSFYFWNPKKYQMRDAGSFPEKFTSAYAREWSVAWENLDME